MNLVVPSFDQSWKKRWLHTLCCRNLNHIMYVFLWFVDPLWLPYRVIHWVYPVRCSLFFFLNWRERRWWQQRCELTSHDVWLKAGPRAEHVCTRICVSTWGAYCVNALWHTLTLGKAKPIWTDTLLSDKTLTSVAIFAHLEPGETRSNIYNKKRGLWVEYIYS